MHTSTGLYEVARAMSMCICVGRADVCVRVLQMVELSGVVVSNSDFVYSDVTKQELRSPP
jgi:hypothetical protein